MEYAIFNEKDEEVYIKQFLDDTTARHWAINHLDLSKNWTVARQKTDNEPCDCCDKF